MLLYSMPTPFYISKKFLLKPRLTERMEDKQWLAKKAWEKSKNKDYII